MMVHYCFHFLVGQRPMTAGDRSVAIGVLGNLIALALVNKLFLLCRRYALHICAWSFSSALCPPANNRPETWENEKIPTWLVYRLHPLIIRIRIKHDAPARLEIRDPIFDQHRSQCNARLEKSFVSGQLPGHRAVHSHP